jgi:hypothetical protein
MRFKECHLTKIVLNLSSDCISHLNPHNYNSLESSLVAFLIWIPKQLSSIKFGLHLPFLSSKQLSSIKLRLLLSFQSSNNCLWIKLRLQLPISILQIALTQAWIACPISILKTIVLNQAQMSSVISILKTLVLNQAQTSSLISILKQLSLNQAQIAAPHFNSPNCLESS